MKPISPAPAFSLRTLTAALLLAGTTSACVSFDTMDSDLVDADGIHQGYSAIFDAADTSVTTRATFRAGGSGGTTLNLVSPSKVTVNESSMKVPNTFFGTHYEKRFKNPQTMTFSWLFVDPAGVEHRNTGEIRTLKISNAADSFSRRSNYIVEFSAPNLRAKEEIRLLYSYSTEDGSSLGTLYNVRRSGGRLVIPPQDLSDVPVGTDVTLVFERSYRTGLQQGTEGKGEITATYKTAPINVKIIY